MKNLLRVILLAVLTFLFTNGTFAQGLYVGLNAGYALKMASATATSDVNNHTTEIINYSLGKGFDAGLMLGYMFNKNIGIELGASYLIGGKTTQKYYGAFTTSEQETKASMIRVIPSVVVAAGFEKIDPYAKFGLMVGFGSLTTEINANTTDAYKSTMDTKTYAKIKEKGGVAIGLYSALGANYNLSEKLAVFAELNMENMSYSPTKGEITEYTEDGVDRLGDFTVKEKEFEYVDEKDYDVTTPDSEPSKILKEKLPFSSIGLNVGVKIKL